MLLTNLHYLWHSVDLMRFETLSSAEEAVTASEEFGSYNKNQRNKSIITASKLICSGMLTNSEDVSLNDKEYQDINTHTCKIYP